MKKSIFKLFFIFCVLTLQGQEYEYVPFVTDATCWNYCEVIRTGISDYSTYYSGFKLESDTVIKGLNYKKLYRYDCQTLNPDYVASLREEAKRVYFLEAGQQEEQLMYNFNLRKGDSIHSLYTDLDYEITDIDSVEIAGKNRLQFKLDGGFDTWIEGIGSLRSFYPLQAILTSDIEGINYQKKGTKIIYKTEEWYFNENECNTSEINKINDNTLIHANFDSTKGQLIIKGLPVGVSYWVKIGDLTGKLFIQKGIDANNNSVCINNPVGGVYIYRVLKTGHTIISGKIAYFGSGVGN